MDRIRFQVVAMLVLLAIGATPVRAIEFRGGERVTIAAGEVIPDDLYVTGESIVVDGVVEGDIVAVGRHIVLNGASYGDFIAAGQGVVVNGQVADDVRLAGFALRLGDSAAVGDDVIGAGFSLEAASESLVAGSLVFSGFQALLAGEIRERLLGQMASLRIDGIVGDGGEVAVEGDRPTPPFIQLVPSPVAIPTIPAGLTLGPNANVGGEIVYTSPYKADAAEGSSATLTQVAVEHTEEQVSFVERSSRSTWRLVSVLLVGAGLLVFAPGWLRQRADFISRRPLAAAGWGVVGIAGTPVLALLLAVFTLLVLVLVSFLKLPALTGLVLGTAFLAEGTLVLGFLGALFLLAPAILARWLGRAVDRTSSLGRFLAFALGWVILALLFLVPILGGLAKIVVAVLGLGSLVVWVTRPLLRGSI
jgi:hypothetical protein